MFDILGKLSKRSRFKSPLRWMFWYTVTMNVLALAPVLHSTQVYDRVLSSRSVSTLIYLTLIVLVCCVVMSALESLRQVVGQRISNIYASQVSTPLFRELASGRHGRGDQATLLRDLATVRGFLSSRAATAIYDLPFALMFLIAMFALNLWLGLLTLAGAALLAALSVHNKYATAAARTAAAQGQSEATTFAQVALQRAEDMRAMGLVSNVLARWGQLQVRSINEGDTAGVEQAIHHGLGRFVRQSLQVISMAAGAYLVIHGDMSGGMIFAASIISGKALQPIEQIIGAWDGIVQATEAEARIAKALDVAEAQLADPVHLPDPVGVVTFENVVYAHSLRPDAPVIIKGVTETFSPGQTVVIVGASGAGKSTLARMLVGAIAPTSGNIRIDGFELSQWESERRGRLLGYVPQDISLFPGSVAENIARMEIKPNSEAVVRAAMKAGVHDLISRFPDGYNTLLGPGHHDISGGQRQRIALARAFYGDPRVLVLDEPNSHLDGHGEELLMKALAEARLAKITTIVISQRRSILQVADHVLLMHDGKLERLQANGREHAGDARGETAPPQGPQQPIRRSVPLKANVHPPQSTPPQGGARAVAQMLGQQVASRLHVQTQLTATPGTTGAAREGNA